MRAILLGAGVIALSTPAFSATVPHKTTTAKPVMLKRSAPDMSAVFAMFDKLFPPQPDPDPARLVLARTSAAAMWPNGAYANLMTGMMGNVFDRVMQLKESDLPGQSKSKVAAKGGEDRSIHDDAIAADPYFDQRSAAMREVVVEEAGKVSEILDPRIRDGLARSMARRFDERQLADINGFFATPSGHALAGQYMQVWVDPDMMRSIFTSMPDMMKLMPDMMKKVKAASDKYPSPPKKAPAASPKH